MSDQSFGESFARSVLDSPARSASSVPVGGAYRKRSVGCSGIGLFPFIIFLVLIFGILFLPPILSDRYAGHGASVGLVSPTGEDAERDLVYSEVNKGNAQANTWNSAANFVNVVGLVLLLVGVAAVGLLFVGFKIALRSE